MNLTFFQVEACWPRVQDIELLNKARIKLAFSFCEAALLIFDIKYDIYQKENTGTCKNKVR